ncbi:MAG TPA: N-acetylmuramoyl-L-alanine amidase, partial [Cyanobacteria bacterium UBA11148]|nr:N-acetylmuramoyl-L-alanine amidase [Cyanobacteria bacterium UBA11148]
NPPISQPRVPNSRILVIVDPGHGGKDPGTIGIGGVQEKNVILPISIEVAQILEQQGVQAILTRSDDTFVSLEGRVQMAERANADLFVSIHANA